MVNIGSSCAILQCTSYLGIQNCFPVELNLELSPHMTSDLFSIVAELRTVTYLNLKSFSIVAEFKTVPDINSKWPSM